MCGISGIWLKQNSSLNIKEAVFKLSQTIKHRGPDGEGFAFFSETQDTPLASEDTPVFKSKELNYIPKQHLNSYTGEANLAFAHRRLSIIDLTDSGHQPMASKDAEIWITYNGEVYNYIELRKELEGLGHQFISATDTEVIINAYKQWGVDCLQKFNGMWAFCLYDKKKQILFCSRDRFGVKPFYYVNNADLFAFASEQKAFIKSGVVRLAVNDKAIHDYFINERIEAETENFFKNILELFPGNFLIVDLKNKTIAEKKYYTLNFEYNKATDALSDAQIIEAVRERTQKAIELRLRSDVPVGSCLSGGIDSSVIATLMAKKVEDPVYLFTSVFKNDASDESKFAELVAKKVNGNYKTVEPSAEGCFKELEKLVYAQDVPIWSTSTYAQYKVMELAKLNNIKVVLDGQGGDELFAGYHHHFIAKWNNLGIKAIADIKRSSKSIYNPFLFYAKEKIKQNKNTHLMNMQPFFGSDFISSYPVINQVKYFDSVNEQLANDFGGRLKSFLKCEDRCGMIHSVESRVPFSDDINLIEYVFSINGNRKIQKGVSKYLLREATKDLLPKEIYTRYDKKGFETPMKRWVLENKKHMFEVIGNERYDFIKLNDLEDVFRQDNKAGNKEVSVLYKLYVLSIWKKVFS